MYDMTIARLEERLEQAEGLLRFFAAYVASHGGEIIIRDVAFAELPSKPVHRLLQIDRDELTNSTRIKMRTKHEIKRHTV